MTVGSNTGNSENFQRHSVITVAKTTAALTQTTGRELKDLQLVRSCSSVTTHHRSRVTTRREGRHQVKTHPPAAHLSSTPGRFARQTQWCITKKVHRRQQRRKRLGCLGCQRQGVREQSAVSASSRRDQWEQGRQKALRALPNSPAALL